LIATYLRSKALGNDFGALVLGLVRVGVIIGFDVVALGNFLADLFAGGL